MEPEGRAAQASGVFLASGVSSALLGHALGPAAAGACVIRSGRLLYADPAALKLFEARDVEVVGRQLSELVEPADRGWVHRSVQSADGSAWHCVTLASGGRCRVAVQLDPEEPDTRCRRVWLRELSAGGARSQDEMEKSPQMALGKDSAPKAAVLICDDEARLATLTAGLLEDYGFSPLTAALGDDALGIVSRAAPRVDVLLLDVNLSTGLSANELLSRISESKDPPPVILTSGLAEEDVPEDLRRHPRVSGYLAKPYSVEQLVAAIENALSRARASR